MAAEARSLLDAVLVDRLLMRPMAFAEVARVIRKRLKLIVVVAGRHARGGYSLCENVRVQGHNQKLVGVGSRMRLIYAHECKRKNVL